MTHARIAALTALAMLAFAGNSVLCRLALDRTAIDPASFMTVRFASAAVLLWLIVRAKPAAGAHGDWRAALVLFAYAVTFTYAYVTLPAAAGALILFGVTQITMIGYGVARGERLGALQIAGVVIAFGGLVGLLLPGLTAPPLAGCLLMIAAGVTWGAFSLLGRNATDAVRANAANFLRVAPLAALVCAVTFEHLSLDAAGVFYAAISGVVTTGFGYIVWYWVLPALQATHAATVQLSVPVLAAAIGVLGLGEPLTWRLVAASGAILGGIALVVRTAAGAAPRAPA